MDLSPEQFKERVKEYTENQEELVCCNLPQYHHVLKKWLYLEEQDIDFIDAALAALNDREIPGDPVWLYLVAPPGGLKSELLRSFRVYKQGYTLDTLTAATFVSGLTEKDPDTGDRVPYAGILQDLDGKTVIIKDFTTILNSSEETKTEIYGQLRSIYDGFYEKAFGTMREKISIEAVIGLLVGVTPVIDKYTRMQSALGERFLKIRNNPDRWNAAQRALNNEGNETQMREELRYATKTYLESLDFSKIPTITEEQSQDILRMAMYVAFMRANVWETYENGRVIDMELMGSEVPTRLAKQFKHLGKLLAVVRRHASIEEQDMTTLGRIARDTAETKKQAIMDHFVSYGGKNLDGCFDPVDIAGHVKGLFRTNTRNHMNVLQALDCMYSTDSGLFGLTDDFKEYVCAVYRLPLVSLQKEPKNGFFSKPIEGEVYRSTLRDTLNRVFNALSDEPQTPLQLCPRLQMPSNEVLRFLGILVKDGQAYEPRPGYWRRVS